MRPPAYLITEGVSAPPCVGDGRQSETSGSPSILSASLAAAAMGVRRYAPNATLPLHISFPCARVTKIAFGGSDLITAFFTSARIGLDATKLQDQPLAGSLFSFAYRYQAYLYHQWNWVNWLEDRTREPNALSSRQLQTLPVFTGDHHFWDASKKPIILTSRGGKKAFK